MHKRKRKEEGANTFDTSPTTFVPFDNATFLVNLLKEQEQGLNAVFARKLTVIDGKLLQVLDGKIAPIVEDASYTLDEAEGSAVASAPVMCGDCGDGSINAIAKGKNAQYMATFGGGKTKPKDFVTARFVWKTQKNKRRNGRQVARTARLLGGDDLDLTEYGDIRFSRRDMLRDGIANKRYFGFLGALTDEAM